MANHEDSGLKAGLTGVIVGVLAAMAAWILSDPKKRQQIKQGVQKLRDEAKDRINDMGNTTEKYKTRAKNKAKQIIDEV